MQLFQLRIIFNLRARITRSPKVSKEKQPAWQAAVSFKLKIDSIELKKLLTSKKN
jgi:hypothetical protein